MKDLKGCLKGLWRMLSLVRGRVLLCSAIYLVEAVCALAFVWYSKKVIDIVTGGSTEPLMASVWLLVGIMVLQVAARIHDGDIHGHALGFGLDQSRIEHLLGFGQGQVAGKLGRGGLGLGLGQTGAENESQNKRNDTLQHTGLLLPARAVFSCSSTPSGHGQAVNIFFT